MIKNNASYYLELIGMDKKLKGYQYSINAINEAARYYGFININDIYEQVGYSFLAKKASVERNIRYAIENTWEQGNIEEIDKLFGYTVDKEKGKPTNSEFIFLIADKIKLNKT